MLNGSPQLLNTPTCQMLHSSAPVAQPVLQQAAMWQAQNTFNSMDLPLLPLFLQAQNQMLQLQFPHSTKVPVAKGSAFTIDAILNRDKCVKAVTEDYNKFRKFQYRNRNEDDVTYKQYNENTYHSQRHHPYLQQWVQRQEKNSDFTKQRKYSDITEKKNLSRSTKGRRVRTIFTPEQLERMESEFEKQQYMVGTERLILASELSLTEAQVKVWFQNRRIKWRKQHFEQQRANFAKFGFNNETNTDSGSESENDEGSE